MILKRSRPANDNGGDGDTPVVTIPEHRPEQAYARSENLILPLRFARRLSGWSAPPRVASRAASGSAGGIDEDAHPSAGGDRQIGLPVAVEVGDGDAGRITGDPVGLCGTEGSSSGSGRDVGQDANPAVGRAARDQIGPTKGTAPSPPSSPTTPSQSSLR